MKSSNKRTSETSSDNSSDQNNELAWKERQTISRRICHSTPYTSTTRGRTWSPNLLKPDYSGLLSILRAEVFYTRTKAEQIETSNEPGEHRMIHEE